MTHSSTLQASPPSHGHAKAFARRSFASTLIADVIVLLLVAPATAQTALGPVIVTATRTPLPLSQVLSDVTLLTPEDIERQGAGSVADVLRAVPGIEFARNGGPGTVTSLFTRGGEGRFTAVLIDGMRVDSQSTGGATWQAIPLSQIDHIEILRGPASAIYGSDAIGGVVQIFTRKGDGHPALDLGLGAGSLGTRQADASVRGAQGTIDYAVSVATERSDGFNAISNPANPSYNPDRDGYASRSASLRLGTQLNAAHRLELVAMNSHLDAQYDGYKSMADDHDVHDLHSLRASWSGRWNAVWQSQLSAGQSVDRDETRPSHYLTETRLRSFAWQNDVQLGLHTLSATLERREDHLDNSSLTGSTTPGKGDRSQDSLALGDEWRDAGKALQAHWRHDNDSEFGGHDTGALTAGLDLPAGWRVTASAGTAFRAPTLFHRFSVYGNPGLRPESSRNVEASLGYREGRTEFGATAYRSQVGNLITFGDPGVCVSAVGCYRNTAQATLQGLTLKGAVDLANVHLSGSLDLQSPTDASTGKLLPRRSRQHAALQADTAVAGWALGAQVLVSGSRYDNVANTYRLGGYGLLNLDAQYRLSPQWRLLLRLDNVFDRDYQTARDYASQPRTGFVALRWTPAL